MAEAFSLNTALKWRSGSQSARKSLQIRLLQTHLHQAYKAPFYKRHFDAINLDINGISTLDVLAKLPLTKRSDLDIKNEDFWAVPRQDFADIAFTSGSTGNSLEIPYTAVDQR